MPQIPVKAVKPLEEREEKAAFSSVLGQPSARIADLSVVRAVVEQLRDRGVNHPTERLRAGTVAFAERAMRAFDADPSKGAGWLARVISDGASLLAEQDGLTERDRDRVAAFDELMAERGLSFD